MLDTGMPDKKIETPKHYTGGVQTVTKQELVASHLEGKISGTKIHHILTALKYLDRAGEKIYDGMDAQQSLEKDCGKCADYIYRALEGVFLNELK